MKYLLILALLALLGSAVPVQDEMHYTIPGYTAHRWYSGYLEFDTGKFHYVFFDSQRDPDNDPVVLWLNGGPGCSSLLGMTYQNGPFLFKEGTVNFQINPYAWNMKANLLYISSPGGVGFSQSKRGPKADDGTVAEDNYKALQVFYSKFPNLKNNEFYITGESYAGIYIPYLAHQIVHHNKLPETETKIKFKGFMVGNACTDPRECWQPGNDVEMGIYQYENLYNHGFYTEDDYHQITGACTLGYHSDACKEVRAVMDKKFYDTKTSMLNLYAKCLFQKVEGASSDKDYVRWVHGKLPMMEDNVICQDMYGIQKFFNLGDVQAQFHVDLGRFDACSDDVATNYTMFDNASYWLYPHLFSQNLRIWVFEGDIDNSVPITGTVAWLTKMRDEFGIPMEQQWREWWVPGLHKHEDQVGGMVWKLRGLTFASVKGAGHMVPKDKPKEAQVLFNAFINGQDLPYNPNIDTSEL